MRERHYKRLRRLLDDARQRLPAMRDAVAVAGTGWPWAEMSEGFFARVRAICTSCRFGTGPIRGVTVEVLGGDPDDTIGSRLRSVMRLRWYTDLLSYETTARSRAALVEAVAWERLVE